MSHYHYFMDTDMSGIKFALRPIPCDFVAFTDQLDHAWISGANDSEHPKYFYVTECE